MTKTMTDLRELAEQDASDIRMVPVEGIEALQGGNLNVDGERLVLDAPSLDTFSNFFGVPKGLMKNLTADLQRDILTHFLGRYDEAQVQMEMGEGQILAVYGEGDRLIPKARYVDVLEAVLPDDATLSRLEWTRGYVWADVVAQRYTVEPRVGDPTLGGFRFLGTVAPARKSNGVSSSPYVCTFMERLACTNGMTRTEEGSVIKVRGNTVDEVIEEMERLARRVLDVDLPLRLEQWGHTAEVTVDNAEAFIHRIARETGLGARVTDEIIERVPSLGDSRENLYDLTNLITSFQHDEDVTENQRLLLQDVGGHIVSTVGGHRCDSCQTLLN
jgi:hypothetical protein